MLAPASRAQPIDAWSWPGTRTHGIVFPWLMKAISCTIVVMVSVLQEPVLPVHGRGVKVERRGETDNRNGAEGVKNTEQRRNLLLVRIAESLPGEVRLKK